MTQIAIIISLISLVAWVTSSTVWAWGAEGHEAVCEIAYQELNREARTQSMPSWRLKKTTVSKHSARVAAGLIIDSREERTARGSLHQRSTPLDHHRQPQCVVVQRCLFSAIAKDSGGAEGCACQPGR